jgi:putative MATE family efflux protein
LEQEVEDNIKTKEKEMDMTKGNIWIQIIGFALPLLIGNLFQQLYNTADSIVVGNYIGSEALAAVGSSNSLINLIIGLFIGIATGSGIVISQYYGAKQHEKVSDAVHTAVTLAFIGGVLLIVIGIIFSPIMLRLMGTPEKVMPSSVLYLRVFFCGSLFNLFYNMGAGILRAVGDSRRPLYYLCIASVVNIVLDLVFVVGFKWGVAGVGLATILAQLTSALLVLRALLKTEKSYQLNVGKLTIKKEMMKKILHMGIPSGMQGAIISLSNVIVQANINAFGADAMAGAGAYMKVDGFVILPIMSFSMATMTFTGQNIGAGQLERVKKGVKASLVIGITYTLFVSFLLSLFGMNIIGIFSSEANVVGYGYLMLKTLVPFYWLLGIAQVLSGAFRGAGKATVAMLIMVGNMCGVRMLWVNTMTPITREIATVLMGYPISWVTVALCTLLYAWKGNWLTHKIYAMQ